MQGSRITQRKEKQGRETNGAAAPKHNNISNKSFKCSLVAVFVFWQQLTCNFMDATVFSPIMKNNISFF